MRGQRRNVRIAHHLEQDGPVRRERRVERRHDLARRIDHHAGKSNEIGIARERKIGEILRCRKFRVAFEHPLLPADHVEIAIVEHDHDEPWIDETVPIFRDGDELVDAVHLHGAVADHGDDGTVRVRQLRRKRVRNRGAHGREIARVRRLHAGSKRQVARIPVDRRAGVASEQRIVGQARRKLPEEPLRVDRIGVVVRSFLERVPPVFDVAFDARAPAPIFLVRKEWQQFEQRLAAVAGEIRFHRIAQTQHPRIEVDLHAACGALFRQKFRIRKTGADHQQRVAIAHHFVRRSRAEKPDAARYIAQTVRQHRFAEQCLGNAGPKLVGNLQHFTGSVRCAGSDKDRHLLARIQDFGRSHQIGGLRDDPRLAVSRSRMNGGVCMWRRFVRELLHVAGNDDACRTARRERNAKRAIDHVSSLLGRRDHLHVFVRDIVEQRQQIDLLLKVPTQGGTRFLTDDRDDRLMIGFRVVESREEVHGTGARRRETHADFTGELSVAACHERRRLFMAWLNEIDRAFGPRKRANNAVDTITGITEDAPHAPFAKALDQKIADSHGSSHSRKMEGMRGDPA